MINKDEYIKVDYIDFLILSTVIRHEIYSLMTD